MTYTFTHENTKFKLSRFDDSYYLTLFHESVEIFTHVVVGYILTRLNLDILECTEVKDLNWEEWFHLSLEWQQELPRLQALIVEAIRNELEAQ